MRGFLDQDEFDCFQVNNDFQGLEMLVIVIKDNKHDSNFITSIFIPS